MRTRIIVAVILSMLLASIALYAKNSANKPPKNSIPQPKILVELFTSESCSSCPTADALLTKSVANYPDILFLSFHVDYWNHLGWKDLFSKKEFTNRQNQYAQWLNTSSIYTPQMVVNGNTEFVGSKASTLTSSLNSAKMNETKPISLKQNSKNIQASIEGRIPNNSTIYLALVQKNALRKIFNGENQGRTLTHTNIVVGLWNKPLTEQSTIFSIPENTQTLKSEEYFWAAFCQENKSGSISALGVLNP